VLECRQSLTELVPPVDRIVVPDHRTLKVGTLSDILAQVAAFKGVNRDRIIETL
jgi:cytidine deaminase